jgi:methylated-DNA-[protein]-cysteine S-methyltransferase
MSASPVYRTWLRAPFGLIGIEASAEAVLSLDRIARPWASTEENAIVQAARRQLEAYFADPCRPFDLPLALPGTPHQQKVWRALRRIPPGKVRTYGELAKILHSSPRAVGNACRANPIAIIVPCHRVVGATDLGGYMGSRAGVGLDMKRWLLAHEHG